MTILRDPTSHYDALRQAVGYLGIDEVAGLMGKSTDVVRKVENPNAEGYHLPIESAMRLDVALIKGGFPPVFAMLLTSSAAEALPLTKPDERSGREAGHEAEHEMVARIVCDGAKVLDTFMEADKDKKLTSAEKSKLLQVTQQLQTRIAAFRRRLFK